MSTFPILSIITISVCVYIFVSHKNMHQLYLYLLLLTFVLEVLHPRGYFLFISGHRILTSVRVAEIFLVLVGIAYLITSQKRVSTQLCYRGYLLFFLALLGLIYEVVIPYDGLIVPPEDVPGFTGGSSWDAFIKGVIGEQHVEVTVGHIMNSMFHLLFLIVNACLLKSICSFDDIVFVLHNSIRYLQPYVAFVIVEYFIKNIFMYPEVWPIFQNIFFGEIEEGAFGYESSLRGDSYTLLGVSSEPMFVIICIFSIILMMLIENKFRQQRIHSLKKIMACIFVTFLTGGFSSYWYLFILILVVISLRYNLYNINKSDFLLLLKHFSLIGIIAFFCGYLIFSFGDNQYLDRLQAVLFFFDYITTTGSIPFFFQGDGSVLARFSSIVMTFEDWLNRPLLGLGLQVEKAHCFTVTMLSDFGIIGTIAWIRFITTKHFKGQKYDFPLFFVVFFVAGLLNGLMEMKYLEQIQVVMIVEFLSIHASKSSFYVNTQTSHT